MTTSVAVMDIDPILQNYPDTLLLEFLHSPRLQQNLVLHAGVRLVYTDLLGRPCSLTISRELHINELEAPEETQ